MPASAKRRRRRWPWLVAVLFLLVAGYPATSGPAVYCWARGWAPGWHLQRFYAPVTAVFDDTPFGDAIRYEAWLDWWYALALRHTGGRNLAR